MKTTVKFNKYLLDVIQQYANEKYTLDKIETKLSNGDRDYLYASMHINERTIADAVIDLLGIKGNLIERI